MLSVEGAVYSDTGQVRHQNEDNLYWQGRFRRANELAGTLDRVFQSDQEAQLYAISDGMGGMARGEIASRIAVAELGALERRVQAAADNQNTALIDEYLRERSLYMARRNENAGKPEEMMGATISLLLLRGNSAYLANMGDTAVFHCRNGTIKQISRDDSHAARLRSLGYLTREEASRHPFRNSLVNYLGKETDADRVEYFLVRDFPLAKGDLFLLCSDGISGVLSRDMIQSVLQSEASVKTKASELVKLAEAAGSADNLTLILLRIVDCSQESTEESGLIEAEDLLIYDPERSEMEERPARTRAVLARDVPDAFQGPNVLPHTQVRLFPARMPQAPGADSGGVSASRPEPVRVGPSSEAIGHGEQTIRKGPTQLTPEQHLQYAKARDAAILRQARRNEKMTRENIQPISPEQQPVSGQYSRPQQPELSREDKARLYDRRYTDGRQPAVPFVEAYAPSPRDTAPPRRPRRRGGLRSFLSWLIFFIFFILLGYALLWLLIEGRGFLFG